MKKRPMSRKAYSKLGGEARAKALSAKRRSAIARKAAFARWAKAPTQRNANAANTHILTPRSESPRHAK